ncbi:MAG: 16S rRNA (uracil(1498)-N(3))-methyltransferase, partial [Acetobacteraceae bacterium]|nr:16S rRNA (uracil(1498)-N(3))-methyltransferase [Acetobacteraceae bacterium]
RGQGDTVRLFNGRDGEWSATVAALSKRRATLSVDARLREQRDELDLWLAWSPLKRDATELVVQKATELGVSALLPVWTERAVVTRLNAERLAAIATEAAEQCERLSIPHLAEPVRLPVLLSSWPRERTLFAAVERQGTTERVGTAALAPARGPAGLLIGPEGGFAPGELDALAACPFVVRATLGPRILRAETAAIAGLALLGAHVGG